MWIFGNNIYSYESIYIGQYIRLATFESKFGEHGNTRISTGIFSNIEKLDSPDI